MTGAGETYFRWYYDTNVWKNLHYRGVRTLKSIADTWSYQELIHEHDVQWVVETGTRHGGSALFFSDLPTLRGARGKVISIDLDAEANWVKKHAGIEFLYGDSAAPEMIGVVTGTMREPRGRIFVILDSDHSRDHVLRELRAYVPILRAGGFLGRRGHLHQRASRAIGIRSRSLGSGGAVPGRGTRRAAPRRQAGSEIRPHLRATRFLREGLTQS